MPPNRPGCFQVRNGRARSTLHLSEHHKRDPLISWPRNRWQTLICNQQPDLGPFAKTWLTDHLDRAKPQG